MYLFTLVLQRLLIFAVSIPWVVSEVCEASSSHPGFPFVTPLGVAPCALLLEGPFQIEVAPWLGCWSCPAFRVLRNLVMDVDEEGV